MKNYIEGVISGLFTGIGLMLFFGSQCEGAEATYYCDSLAENFMANDEPYDPERFTCASWDYPLDTWLLVTYKGKTIEVLVTDRHDYKTDLDLSREAFKALAPLELGRINVEIEKSEDQL